MTVLAGGLLLTSPAQAGGWAETMLDPTPPRIEANTSYTFGYWVLQHGSYPYQGHGDLGTTSLRATDEKGQLVEFVGTKSATEGHYSAEVVFPHEGTWQLAGYHEVLMPDESVATVTVPGPVQILPSEITARAPYEWGAVRPSFPPVAPNAQVAAPGGFVDTPTTTPPQVEPNSQTPAATEQGASLPMGLVIVGGLATIGLAVWLARRAVRSNRAAP